MTPRIIQKLIKFKLSNNLPKSFDFLLGLPSEPGASGLFRGLPDPDFLAAAELEVAASLTSCGRPLSFVAEAGVETGGAGGEVRTVDKKSRISSMMHLKILL